MKEIVVISGKGGTGKTSITASFAVLGGQDVVAADCDVDASDMHLLLQPDFNLSEEFYSGEVAEIVQSRCTACDRCLQVCRFGAISVKNGKYVVDPVSCEGCGYCARICPTKAIINQQRLSGRWFLSNIKTGSIMVHARLGAGAENSGKLVAKVKHEAQRVAVAKQTEFILVDGAPGIGCPVVSSLSGADFVVLVTEPTVSGLHDLIRVHKLIKRFNLRAGCIINKADINLAKSSEIEKFLKQEDIVHLTNIPYDDTFTKAMTRAMTVVESDTGKLTDILTESWKKIKQLVTK